MRKILLIIVLCCGWPVIASAEATGNDLLQYCDRPNGGEELCVGYISGALDAFMEFNDMAPADSRLFCVPPEATGKQIVAMTKKFLKDNPERLHHIASTIILGMMTAKFPCQNSK